jgi:hypothetical protein
LASADKQRFVLLFPKPSLNTVQLFETFVMKLL